MINRSKLPDAGVCGTTKQWRVTTILLCRQFRSHTSSASLGLLESTSINLAISTSWSWLWLYCHVQTTLVFNMDTDDCSALPPSMRLTVLWAQLQIFRKVTFNMSIGIPPKEKHLRISAAFLQFFCFFSDFFFFWGGRHSSAKGQLVEPTVRLLYTGCVFCSAKGIFSSTLCLVILHAEAVHSRFWNTINNNN